MLQDRFADRIAAYQYHVPFNYIGADADGAVYIYENIPYKTDSEWRARGGNFVIVGGIKDNAHWDTSLESLGRATR